MLCVTMSRCVCCELFSREFVDLMLVIVWLLATCAYYTVCRQQINIKNLLNGGPQHIYIAFVKSYLSIHYNVVVFLSALDHLNCLGDLYLSLRPTGHNFWHINLIFC